MVGLSKHTSKLLAISLKPFSKHRSWHLSAVPDPSQFWLEACGKGDLLHLILMFSLLQEDTDTHILTALLREAMLTVERKV